jgi:D-3-phosphoglycerate dehydrogenase
MRTAVLTDSARFPFSSADRDRLAAAEVRLVLVEGHSHDEVLAAADGAHAMFVYSAVIDEAVTRRLSTCRLLVRCGSGYDNIDVAAARSRGIPVAYVPGYGTDDVAEHALALMLACSRRLVSTNLQVRGGGWPVYADIGPMRRLRNSTLGLVGFGRIARRLAQMASGLRMRTVAYDPFVGDEVFVAEGVTRCTLAELTAVSDVISLHTPLLPATAAMVDAAFLDRVKPGTILVNTGRGELIDQPALLASLQRGHLGGVGLDVLTQEPPDPHDPLLTQPNAVITSHSAAFTEEALAAVRSLAIDEVLRVFAGEEPKNPVPYPTRMEADTLA